MTARALLVLAALALSLAAGHADAAPAAGRIVVGPVATVDRASIRLADLAVLEGDATAFADVDLGAAPDPGASRRLDGVAILRRLREAGLDDRATRYEIPAQVRVARAFQEIGTDELRGAVTAAAPRVLGGGASVRRFEIAAPARIPPGPYEIRVHPSLAAARGARRRLDLEIVQEGNVVATTSAQVDVADLGPVVVLRRSVARGAVLVADDLAVEERDLAGLDDAVVTEVAQAIDKEARTALAAGTPLTQQALASPLLVRRGDIVTVVVETPAMRLAVPGEALEAGTAGTSVRVRNRASQQELAGQVVERGTILVRY
jgi:flagella basal body P-ring formation protein FlgA